MTKKAFTLIEILVSIVLLGLISLFVTSTIYQTKNSNKLFRKKIDKISKIEKFQNILYKDLLQSNNLNIKDSKHYSIVYFRSRNSIYGISNPYVLWFVSKKNNTLVRIESPRQIQLPLSEDKQKRIFLDIVKKDCNSFLVRLSKNKKNILVYIEIKNQKASIFEVSKI